jgi:hypothetical protein
MESPVITLAQASELLGTTQDWLQRSTCPRRKIGGKVFFLRDVCIDWVRGHTDGRVQR